jgi:hypothetical protein
MGILFSVLTAFPQAKIPAVDKSPMDMAYYPANYPILKIQDKITEPLVVRVTYSRPQKAGRTVFGELVEYGKVWRLGANEATEIEFFSDVTVAGKSVPKGRYTMYAIPETDKWVLIINKETDIWGSFKYDMKKDVLRVDIPVQKVTEPVESFFMSFNKSGDGFELYAAWDNAAVTIPMKVNTKQSGKATPVKKKSA